MAATLWAYWAGNDGLWHGPEESVYATAIDACKVADQIFVQWPAQWGLKTICQVWVGNDMGLQPSLVYQRNFDPSLDSIASYGGAWSNVKTRPNPSLGYVVTDLAGALASAFTWDAAMALYTPTSRPYVTASEGTSDRRGTSLANFWINEASVFSPATIAFSASPLRPVG
jgi:hypothetical protein